MKPELSANGTCAFNENELKAKFEFSAAGKCNILRKYISITKKENMMSKELAKTYDPKEMEDRIYDKWLAKKYFHAEVDHSKTPFTIVIPPPNITGQLHMGHALYNTMQDIIIRYNRMKS